MIDSLISGMPYSDNSGALLRGGVDRGSSGDKSLPHCKKRKKSHKWPPTKKCRVREAAVPLRCKPKKRVRRKPEAPFNSTQFIMEEHDNLNDSDLSTSRPRRHRDSSLSMESEDLEDDLYFSPEDEEEKFMTRQFWCAFEDYNAERLYAMSKTQLIQEYFALEDRLTDLEKELQAAREQDRRRIREPSPIDDEEEEETVPGEVPVDAETAAKIEIFRSEIQKLEVENEALKKDNLLLRRKHSSRRCSTANNSSSSSSDSSSSSSSSSSDDEENNPTGATSYTFKSREFSSVTNNEEFEICDSAIGLKGDECYGPDSGIASSEGAASSASSGEDAKEKDERKVFPEGGTKFNSNLLVKNR